MHETAEEIKQVNGYLWDYNYWLAESVRRLEEFGQGVESAVDSEGNKIGAPPAFLELEPDNPARREMVRLAQELRKRDLDNAAMALRGTPAFADGLVGRATLETFSQPRCGMPDFGFPRAPGWEEAEAEGEGPWKGCHGIVRGHAVHFQYKNEPPAHMLQDAGDGETVFTKVLWQVREVNAKKGLLCYFSGPSVIEEFHPPDLSSIQSTVTWTRGAGWIGLAIVGNNGLTCRQQIWIRYDNGWGSGFAIARLIHGMVLLKLHEIGHNEGWGHTNGGVMNSYIDLDTIADWDHPNEPLREGQKRKFSGVAVPIPGPDPPGPDPDPDPDPDDGFPWECTLKLIAWFWKNRQSKITQQRLDQIERMISRETSKP